MKKAPTNHLLFDGFYSFMVAERRLAPNTVQSYGRDLSRYIAFIEQVPGRHVRDCTRADLLRFLNHEQEKGLSARTLARMLSSIKTFYRYLVIEGVLEESPFQDVQTPRLEKSCPVSWTARRLRP